MLTNDFSIMVSIFLVSISNKTGLAIVDSPSPSLKKNDTWVNIYEEIIPKSWNTPKNWTHKRKYQQIYKFVLKYYKV